MRVVVAPDSFGGALDSVGVAAAIATGWRLARPDDAVVVTPMADGGEGTLAAVAAAIGEGAIRRIRDRQRSARARGLRRLAAPR